MECVVFVGLQASGKSSFYIDRFFKTHVRISLDVVRTRNRQRRWIELCLQTEQRFVVDNTNPLKAEREKFIPIAKQAGYRIVGYYFRSRIQECLRRNARRKNRVPELAIPSTANKLELPSMDEGFDALKYVRLTDNGFWVDDWKEQIDEV